MDEQVTNDEAATEPQPFRHKLGVQLKGADKAYLKDANNKIVKVEVEFTIPGFPLNIAECQEAWGDDFCYKRLTAAYLNTPSAGIRRVLAELQKSGTAEVITIPVANAAAVVAKAFTDYDGTADRRAADPAKAALDRYYDDTGSREDYNAYLRAREDEVRQSMRKVAVEDPAIVAGSVFLDHAMRAGGKDGKEFIKELKALAKDAVDADAVDAIADAVAA